MHSVKYQGKKTKFMEYLGLGIISFVKYMYIIVQKFGLNKIFVIFFKEYFLLTKAVFIYQKYSTIFLYYNLKKCEYIVKCNLFSWSKLSFQHHYSSLQKSL